MQTYFYMCSHLIFKISRGQIRRSVETFQKRGWESLENAKISPAIKSYYASIARIEINASLEAQEYVF